MNSFLIAIIGLVGLAAFFGLILGFISIRFKVKTNPIVDDIDRILPQTQCGQCGYPGCRPYAEAIAKGDAINKCPPGGQAGVEKLANLMNVPLPEMDENVKNSVKKVAFIHEDRCIGCTKCLQACPVDAIIGGTKSIHTIISEECTGCNLCVAPCPTDCIELRPVKSTPEHWQWDLNSIPVVNITDTQKKLEP